MNPSQRTAQLSKRALAVVGQLLVVLLALPVLGLTAFAVRLLVLLTIPMYLVAFAVSRRFQMHLILQECPKQTTDQVKSRSA